MKLEVVVIPVSTSIAPRILREPRMEARRRLRRRRRLARIQFHAARLAGLGHLRQEGHGAAAPGSAQGLYPIVTDIEVAWNELLGRGVEVSDIFHGTGDMHTGTDEPYLSGRHRVSGPIPTAAATALRLVQ